MNTATLRWPCVRIRMICFSSIHTPMPAYPLQSSWLSLGTTPSIPQISSLTLCEYRMRPVLARDITPLFNVAILHSPTLQS